MSLYFHATDLNNLSSSLVSSKKLASLVSSKKVSRGKGETAAKRYKNCEDHQRE